MPERKIYWLKWQDPLAHLVDKNEGNKDEDLDELISQSARDSFREPDDPKMIQERSKNGNTGPCVITPVGLIPMHEDNLPSKLFNFWMGHTNFDLTKDISKKIAAVEGVESLDIFTRYRFRISVGKVFNQQKVKKAIDAAMIKPIDKVIEAPKQEDTLDSVKVFLNNKYKYWAIAIMANGKVHTFGGDSLEETKTKSEQYKKEAKQLIVSW